MTRPKVGRQVDREPPRDSVMAGEGQPHSVFLRGLTLGALVGAAIAGSAIWDRRRAHRALRAIAAESAAPPNGRDAGNV